MSKATDTPNSLIIFGFTGDLSRRKLLPALYDLELHKLLSSDFQILGVIRRRVDMQELKDQIFDHVEARGGGCDMSVLNKLSDRIKFINADVTKKEDYPSLKTQLDEALGNICTMKLFYFAVPPGIFEQVITNMVEANIHECGANVQSRLLIEKPFGHNLKSAKELIATINKNFGQESIYRIDHYMAKDTVQNILHFRFHNPMLKNIWDNASISSIQVSALEDLDIQGRANFYENTGALRDMVQSHLLQLLALTTMDEPQTMSAADVRRQRQLLLQSLKPIKDVQEQAVRGQYEGYRNEVDNENSSVETFVSLKLEIDSTRFRGVPIYLRAGKAMSAKKTEINVIFKSHAKANEDNVLTFRIQPNEGIALRLASKKPGLSNETQMISLDYSYKDDADTKVGDAYARILKDAISGDQTLFPSDEEILNNWALIQPLLDVWASGVGGLDIYPKGSSAIKAADELLNKQQDHWF